MGKNPEFSLYCLDVGDVDALAVDTPAAGAPLDPQRLRRDLLGVAAAYDVARRARVEPATYGGRLWVIPLYNLPFDTARVTMLAHSVMCGRDPRCSVHFETAAR